MRNLVTIFLLVIVLALTATASEVVWNPTDATASIQAALDGTDGIVTIPYTGQPWITRPLSIRRSLTLVLEPGVELQAKRGEFRGARDCLIRAVAVSGVRVVGTSATLRMWRDDYARLPYERAEWRHCLMFLGCTNVTVEGLTCIGAGGDGFYVGADPATRKPCRSIHLSDCTADANYRQGLSVTSCNGLIVERCTFINTGGTLPGCGVDIEPNFKDDVVTNLYFRNCVFAHNSGPGLSFFLSPLDASSTPVNGLVEHCWFDRNCTAYLEKRDINVWGPRCAGLVTFSNCNVRALYQGDDVLKPHMFSQIWKWINVGWSWTRFVPEQRDERFSTLAESAAQAGETHDGVK